MVVAMVAMTLWTLGYLIEYSRRGGCALMLLVDVKGFFEIPLSVGDLAMLARCVRHHPVSQMMCRAKDASRLQVRRG